MHPAYSVILFTTASGAGHGLLVWLGVAGPGPLSLDALLLRLVARPAERMPDPMLARAGLRFTRAGARRPSAGGEHEERCVQPERLIMASPLRR